MALSFNGVTPTAVIYNGTALTKIIYNGVTVWSKATPFNLPNSVGISYTINQNCNGDAYFNGDSCIYFWIQQHSESNWIDGTATTGAFNRNGCTTMMFNIPHTGYMNGGGYVTVGFGGVTMNVSQAGDYSLDISNAPDVGSVTISFPGLQANRAIHVNNIRFS